MMVTDQCWHSISVHAICRPFGAPFAALFCVVCMLSHFVLSSAWYLCPIMRFILRCNILCSLQRFTDVVLLCVLFCVVIFCALFCVVSMLSHFVLSSAFYLYFPIMCFFLRCTCMYCPNSMLYSARYIIMVFHFVLHLQEELQHTSTRKPSLLAAAHKLAVMVREGKSAVTFERGDVNLYKEANIH